MSSIFLSHTSIDKPFVEKLARDLKRIGVNVWFDKWEIKMGESITWRIEEGIRENEYLGIVLSPEALSSEWVKSELGAAWAKQMQLRKYLFCPSIIGIVAFLFFYQIESLLTLEQIMSKDSVN
ncbi:toll/interleukin-1 receptor domain-containing protein [Paenibacillus polymyxa]|uniref:toll/interleukin-1 receptor domain-containing protein n=1 Tax=Paenibacillus polymyxa TaxID=1406 RepID=UPI003D2C8417